MRDRIEGLLRDVQLLDAHRARVGQQSVLADTSTSERSGSSHGPLTTSLQNTLYVKYYCALPEDERAELEDFVPFVDSVAPPSPSADIGQLFLDQLRAANGREEQWTSGWNVHGMTPDGRCILFCGETIHLAGNLPDQVQGPAYRTNSDSRIGGAELRMPAEDISFATGFYFAYGATPADALLQNCIVRLYFNLSAAGAPSWLRFITTTLDKHQIPFTLKCLLHPAHFRRSDAAVLYVARSNLAFTWAALQPGLPELAMYLRSSVPMFAWKAHKGIGIADDPANGESFGQHRMRLVALALQSLYRFDSRNAKSLEQPSLADKWNALESYFAQNGVALANPHVGGGFADFVPQLVTT